MNGRRLAQRILWGGVSGKVKRIATVVTDAAAPEIGYKSGEELRDDIKEAAKGLVEGVSDLETKAAESRYGVEIPIYDGALPKQYQRMAQVIPKPSVFEPGEDLDSRIRRYAKRIHADAAVKVKTDEFGGKVVDFYQLKPKPQK